MHVACVNQDPGIAPGRAKGAAVHLEAMRRAFAAAGARVTAIDSSDPGETRSRLDEADRAEPLALVYERYALGRSAAARFATGNGVPYVVEVNAPLAVEESRWRRGRDDERARAEDGFLFAAATAVVAVSSAVGEYACDRGARPEVVDVAANAVDPALFSPARRAEWRGEAPVPAGRFVLGFHGRLRPWHGFPMFARACGELVRRGVEAHALVVGAGELRDQLARELPADRFTVADWTGHEQVGRYVALFDALPLTYSPDLPCYFSPLKLAEAMASGAVPVVPSLGDLPDAVGSAGVVYPAGDLDTLVRELEALAREPERRRTLGEAAAARARRNTWEALAARILERAGTRTSR